ncbi:hypothetical protein [Patiriisocius marinistellae]|uniref:hypothetical protein n=1 Tax=Patiriisocius marinistellae TaxID=2494560 RepID=UPI00125E8C7F|nr:hypothetical protein [Patiriisocius marinistellae]
MNNKIFELVSVIEEIKPEKVKQKKSDEPSNLKGSSVINLGKVSNIKRYNTDELGNKLNYSQDLKGGGHIRFNNENYRKVIEIAESIIETKEFNEFTDVAFIEEHICNWAFKTYIEKRANEEPINYLRRILDDKKQEYIFYFSTTGLHIEENLVIGNSELIHIDEDFLNRKKAEYKKDNNNYDRATLEGLTKALNNQIVFKSIGIGTNEFARKKAVQNVKISANLLKMFLLVEINDPNTRLFDLEFDTYLIPMHTSFSETNTDKFDLSHNLSANYGAKPTEFTKKRLKEIEKLGFNFIKNYLDKKASSELDYFIRDLIIQAGRYSSQLNPYEKNVMMISWFESIFIQEQKGKSRGLTKLKLFVIPNLVPSNETELLEKIFISHYRIRDRYLHNGLELRFDNNLFYKFHYVAIIMLKKLITLSENINTKSGIIDYFEKN